MVRHHFMPARPLTLRAAHDTVDALIEASHRFAALVNAPGDDIPLDEGALCIAAHAHPGLDVDAWIARVDDLAVGCAEATLEGIVAELFGTLGFRGDTRRYGDPEHSFLDSVISRRLGIPITLSVLVIEVARRLGVVVLPVGMPGHFLVRAADCTDRWCDPFHGGRTLDREECHALFDSVYRGARAFDRSDLEPTPARAVLARILANLENGELAADPVHLAWMCELHLGIPGVVIAERIQVLRRLARVVEPARAACAYEEVARTVDGDVAARLHAEARQLRSRLN